MHHLIHKLFFHLNKGQRKGNRKNNNQKIVKYGKQFLKNNQYYYGYQYDKLYFQNCSNYEPRIWKNGGSNVIGEKNKKEIDKI